MKKAFFLLMVTLALVAGCRRSHDSRLSGVQALCNHHPEEALAKLDSIDYNMLSQADRYFYDFLKLKASDKAYITHTSDSTIVKLLDYYDGDRELGSEVLYYGGRVYSDLGDYPTALNYFQKALEATPTEENPELRSSILSQTGRLLNDIHLYREAIPYLKECLTLDSILCDTFNLAYDNQLIAGAYKNSKQLDSAYYYVDKSVNWAANLPANDFVNLLSSKAAILCYSGKVRDSYDAIRKCILKIDKKFGNHTLLYATDIYLRMGKNDVAYLDTAYIFVNELIHSTISNNRLFGYQRLFSTELRKRILPDSLNVYYNNYYNEIYAHYSKRESDAALIQDSFFNYQQHEKARRNAERKQQIILNYLYLVIFLALGLVLIMSYSRVKTQRRIINLQFALENLSKTKVHDDTDNEREDLLHDNKLEDELRNRLRSELIKKATSNSSSALTADLLNDEIVINLKKMADGSKHFAENDPIWGQLENLVLSYRPKFIYYLQLMAGAPLRVREVHIVLLIKCGFTPTEIQNLFSRAKGTISKRKELLAVKILGQKIDSKSFNNIIRSL